IDVLVELPEGFVIIDHKSFPGSAEEAIERAAGYAGQLGLYAEAVEQATGRPVLETAIHFAVQGTVVPVIRISGGREQ
ncbi:hypothetical protein D6779_09215, partial [Candidatus Parcubacteria bacterium]